MGKVNPRSAREIWIFRERSSIRYGIAKIPIAPALLGCSILMFLLYGLIWLVERGVLIDLIGFDVPFIIKMFSFFSTISLFAFLINSTGVIYFVVVSSVVYFVTHSLMVSGLIEYYFKFKEYDGPFSRMVYYTPPSGMFTLMIILNIARLILVIPFCYYSLILFTMRKAGGTGWSKVPAFQLELETIPKQIEELNKRQEYVKRRVEIL